MTAAPSSVAVGDVVTVNVTADGLVDAYAYELKIDYDPALVEFIGDSGILPSGGFGTVEADTGTVGVVATRLGSSPGLIGDQTLISLSFTAIAPGITPISVTRAELVDSDSAATAVDTSAASFAASVTIAGDDETSVPPAPEPENDAPDASGSDNSGEKPGAGALANTGMDATPWLVAGASALLLIAAGAALALRRRRKAL